MRQLFREGHSDGERVALGGMNSVQFSAKIGLKTPKGEMLGANELAACKARWRGAVSQ